MAALHDRAGRCRMLRRDAESGKRVGRIGAASAAGPPSRALRPGRRPVQGRESHLGRRVLTLRMLGKMMIGEASLKNLAAR